LDALGCNSGWNAGARIFTSESERIQTALKH